VTTDDDRYRDWDAAYVLGALPAHERLEYERHLETCASCRAAVAQLAGMPGILGRLSADEAVAVGSGAVGDPVARAGDVASAAPDGRPGAGPAPSLPSVRRSRRDRQPHVPGRIARTGSNRAYEVE
jgi:anti-sigma factor RsiW